MDLVQKTALDARKRLFIIAYLRTAMSMLFFWCIVSIPILLLKQFLLISFNPYILIIILLVLFTGSFFLTYIKRPDIRQAMLELDLASGSKARLISALSVLSENTGNPYSGLIVDDAAKLLPNINLKQAFPQKLPKFSIALPFLLLIILALFVFQIPPYWFRNIDPVIYNEGLELEEFARKLEGENQSNPDVDNLALAAELEKLAREMQEQPLTRNQAQQKIQELTQRIEEQHGSVGRDDLPMQGETSDSLGDEIEDALEMMNNNSMNREEINELKRKLMSSDSISESTKQDMEDSFDEYDRNPDPDAQQDLAQDLEEALEQEQQENSPQESQNIPGAAEEAADQLEQSSNDINESPFSQNSSDTQNSTDGEETSGDGMETEASGRGSGVGDDAESDFNRENQQNGEQQELRGEITKRDQLKKQIRVLPEIADEEVQSQDIDLEYTQAVEAAILQEDIPVALREYIKEYFSAIGAIGSSADKE